MESGVVGELHEMLFVKEQLVSHEPVTNAPSMPSSSDAICVSRENCFAANWSIVTLETTFASVSALNGTELRNVPEAGEWPPPLDFLATASLLSPPIIKT